MATSLETISPVFLGKRDAAVYLVQSVRQLDYERAKGNLPFYRLPGKIVYSTRDLDAWMARFRVDPEDDAGEAVS